VKVDLHVHAKERSFCATAGEEEMIRAAIQRGLDGLAFTDHGRLIPPQRVAELREKYAPFRVFTGIEIGVEGEDLLVLGLHDPLLETRPWTYPELYTFVRQRGGFLALAHPFRFHEAIAVDIEEYPPDAVEVGSVNMKGRWNGRIRALAERLGLGRLCNSDGHGTDDLGIYYNVLSGAPQNDEELVSVLRAGNYRCNGAGEV